MSTIIFKKSVNVNECKIEIEMRHYVVCEGRPGARPAFRTDLWIGDEDGRTIMLPELKALHALIGEALAKADAI